MKILYITEISLFPINGGEKIRTYGLLKSLVNETNDITAIVSNNDSIDFNSYKNKYKLSSINFKTFKRNKSSKFNTVMNYFRMNDQIKLIINELDESFDLVVIDYLFLGSFIKYFKNKNIPVIYGTHNAQANLTKQEEKKTLLSNVIKNINYYLQSIHEKIYFPKADKLLVVSNPDKEYHKDFVDSSKIEVIPNFLDESLYLNDNLSRENYIVMTGNFNAYQNFHGLKWFLENIWDDELASKTSLKIVGKGSKGILSKLNIENFESIEEVGMVDDINEYIAKSRISIIPLLHGSGTRLKCLEAMALKTPIVSTSQGAEGIEHENTISIADNETDFKNNLLNILKSYESENQNLNEAYDIFLGKYSLLSNRKKIENIINMLK